MKVSEFAEISFVAIDPTVDVVHLVDTSAGAAGDRKATVNGLTKAATAFGRISGTLGFYGSTPVVQPTFTVGEAGTDTVTAKQIADALVALGLVGLEQV